ncbi:hypothetical protein [Streptomyces atratus]|uniref:hypothetical protein n=1 Tax=Streptomyces atratus TaxID=1893 RepID=UPI0037A9EA20
MRDDTIGLVWKGISYDTGTNYAESGLSRKPVPSGLIRQHMAVIRNDLNCTSVNLFGTDIRRLTETAGAALDLGLHVSLQPRVIEAEPDAMLQHLAAAATAAEELRERYGRVTWDLNIDSTVCRAHQHAA